MNIGRIFPFAVMLAMIPAYVASLSSLSLMHHSLPKGDDASPVLPAAVLKITSLEHDGVTADFLYLRGLVFYGSTYEGEGKTQRAVKGWEYTWLYHTLKAATDLDPYFLDPYFFANSVLVWDAGRVREANALLEKGSHYRDWDYWLPFYLGFNYYYFLNDNVKASASLMEASKRPGAGSFIPFFAARIAYKGNRTENAIIFLEGVLKTTKDESMRKDYETRLETFKRILFLEKGVVVYQKKVGKTPENLNALVEQQIIGRIPEDPYGGKFYIDKDGSIKTTSELRPMK